MGPGLRCAHPGMGEVVDYALQAFERLFGPEFGHGEPFDLAPLRAALAALGEPHAKLPPVIHVAGTNGKGSTIAFMRAIAEAAGLSVHAFTKPHLFRVNERFLIAGASPSDEALVAAAERIAAVAPGLSQFDAQVAAAFLMFGETPADLALLETGVGGRDDSTNVIERPVLSVITPIASDHEDILGATLADIAAHKAGIFKAGVPAIVARQREEVRAVLAAEAERLAAQLLIQGVDWDAYMSAGRLVVQTETRALDLPAPSLHGAHQIDNAGLACAALMRWRDLDDEAFAAGVANANLPARLQPLTRGPLSEPIRTLGGEVWVDCGHNEHGAAALSAALNAMQRTRPMRVIAIIGLRARKNAEAFVNALAGGAADKIIAVPLADEHIAPEQIAALARQRNITGRSAATLKAAMKNAARAPAPRVVICGSFLLAAEALGLEQSG